MAISLYQNAASGNPTNTWFSPELLMAADAVQVFDKFVKLQRVPLHKNENVDWLRAVTPVVDVTESPEGVSKASRNLTFENITVKIQEFAESFAFSSRQADMGEVDLFEATKNRLTDLKKRTREKNAWFTYRNANNVFYNSQAITSRAAVGGPISLGVLHKAERVLLDNRATYVSEMSKASTNYSTYPVEECWPVFCHTNCRSDIRALPGFIPYQQVANSTTPIRCFGHVENFAFFCSPEFEPRLAAGAAVGSTLMKSAGGANVDVYSYVIMGKEAFGRVSLAGSMSDSGMGGESYYILKDADKSDRNNRIRIVGCNWYDGPVILNQNWTIVIEAGVTANPV